MKRTQIAVLVISEDGMVDFVPHLRPIIKRSLVENIVTELKTISLDETISIKKFNSIIDSLYNMEFYLNSEQCSLINEKRKEIEKKLWEQNDGGYAQMIREDLVPDSECNSSYFE